MSSSYILHVFICICIFFLRKQIFFLFILICFLKPYPRTLGASLKLPIDTSGSYIASSITEWIFVIFFCCFFFTFFNEAQQYSLLIVIETHSTKEQEVIEDTKAEIRRLSLAIEKEKSTLV